MKFIKCGSLKIMNLDPDTRSDSKKKQNIYKQHGRFLPNSIRCIICGPSNCGKTNVMVTLLTHPEALCFENIYLYSKSQFQPKYKLLAHVLKRIKEIGFFPYASSENIVKFENAKRNSIFIFDDVCCDKQNDCIREYFSMGRHKNIDTFYINQTYMRCPKHLIR